ncbi:CRISPR-associated endoribonuclease Cas6 [uncultured Maribacter sp.]|uniref:CRISPR-associated endoribonuclease Cas6 n=1 Tax=uncultured Maribacter sp. TaxID=431308 RepID=UPI00260C5628|nr:CRISPR-associated endoribonuclease Cas6 [uncultured Maribacter sp.]
MRLHLKLTKSSSPIPFNYQHLLTGCFHKWLGKSNVEHGAISMYSFSWLQNVKATKKGLHVTPETSFFINFYDAEIAKKVIEGILAAPEMFHGVSVQEVYMQEAPNFANKAYFYVASPVLVKRDTEKGKKHYQYFEEETNQLLTQTLQLKLEKAGLSTEGVSVRFDSNYTKSKTKIVSYKEIKNKVNICPVVIEGSPEQIAFAWNVGVGNSTGIGFGALM